MVLNELGQIAYDEWLKTPELRPNVFLDVFVIMPNHMHGIIVINDDSTMDRGELHSPNNIDDRGESNSPDNVEGTKFRSPSNNIGAIVRGYKSAVTKQINLLNYGSFAWQRNYYEHIIRNEQSYQRISDYIINNPANWNNDKFYIE
jgi:putative transposase